MLSIVKSNSAGGLASYDTGSLSLRVRTSLKARRVSIRIRHDGEVVVTVPRGMSPAYVERFVRSKRGWISRTLSRIERERPDFRTGSRITVLDDSLTIVVERAGELQEGVVCDGRRIVVSSADDDPVRVRSLMRQWLRTVAQRELPALVEREAVRHGFRYRRVQIRDQQTRWGSCSRLGALSFNWRLVLLPAPVRRYLIIHELCHLHRLDHSPRFWREVERLDPGWHSAEQWLRRHGRTVAW